MKKIVFHVGMMKSGTTYIQEILSDNRESLKRNGWEYPGLRLNQQHACYSLCRNDIPWNKNPGSRMIGRNLVRKIKNSNNNVIISSEALSTLDDQGAERFITTAGRPDKVIFTVRGLALTLPSAWQQYLKGGGRAGLRQFIDRLELQRESLSGFWRTYGYGHAIARWSKYADVDVVILPSSSNSPLQLWNMFRTACELPDFPVNDVPPQKSNISLCLEEAKLLKKINKILPKDSKDSAAIRSDYLNSVVFPTSRRSNGTRIQLPKNSITLVSNWNKEEYELLVKYGKNIHGNLDDLLLPIYSPPGKEAVQGGEAINIAANQIATLLSRKLVHSE